MSFQGLRVGDQNGTFPIVAPLIEGRYEPNFLFWADGCGWTAAPSCSSGRGT